MNWIKATEARKRWSEVIDNVIRQKPLTIKRNRDRLTLFSIEQVEGLLSEHQLHVSVMGEPDGSITGIIEELDLAENATSRERLIQQLLDTIIDYSDEYMENFNLYFNSPNRKSHFPYIYKVYLFKDDTSKVMEYLKITRTK